MSAPPSRIAGEGTVGSPTYLSDEKTMVFRLHNFETLEKRRHKTTSVACHGYKWAIRVYPWGDNEDAQKEGKMSVYLCRVDDGASPVSADYSILIGNTRETVTYNFKAPSASLGWRRFMDRSKAIQEVDENGTLTITVTIRCRLPKLPTWKPRNTFQSKLRELYNTEKGSDVTFSFGNGNIVRAHRAVLSVQCPEGLLQEIVSEATDSGNIEIEDTDADLFAMMIRFLYLEALPGDFDLKANGVELLKLANKFGCVDLKMHLEADLIDSDVLTVETAAEYLALADAHNCALLKEAAMDIMVANSAEVIKTKGWDTLKESASLLSEVFQLLADPGKQNNSEKVTLLRKRLAEADQDVDGTKEMLVKRCRTMKDTEQDREAAGQQE